MAAILFGPLKVQGHKRPAHDARRRIVVDRSPKALVARRSVFDDRPAIVGAPSRFIDLFRVAANVVDKNATGFSLNGEGKGVPQSQRQIAAYLPVVLETKGLSAGMEPSGMMRKSFPKGVQVLCRLARGLVADRHIELAVIPEVDTAA